VGRTVTKKSRKVKDKLWLEGHNPTTKSPRERRDPPNKKQISIGSMFVGYDPVYRPSYGAESRDDYKQAKLFKSLHYTDDNDVRVNGKIKNAGGFKANEIFGKQTKGGIVGGYSNSMKGSQRPILTRMRKMLRTVNIWI
jgi:hypothetical protein